MKKFSLKITFLLSIFLTVMLSSLSYAKDNSQAMIVFDASGSMWGQIDDTAKISIAKQAINKVVTHWDENVHLGLMAYGHRKKGDCDDIETLVPLSQIDRKSILAQIKKINPKGKTPISRSIKKAAEALKFTEEKATVILISDGKETCDPDPCATAKLLEQQGIDFVTHVVGFNVDKQTDEQLQCIASATGGEYFSAKNATALNEAISVIAEKVTQEEPPKPVIKALKNNLEITASETEGGKWVKVHHQILVIDGDDKTRITSCSSTKKESCLTKLPAGDYVIASSYNKLKKETAIQLADEKHSKVHIIMGSTGKVDITATEEDGGKWVKAYHQVFTIDGEDKTRVTSCSSTKKKACLQQIPVGQYTIESSYNKLKTKTELEISAGKVTKLNIVMGSTGKVEISATEEDGGKWVKAYHQVFTIDGEDKTRITSCSSTKKKACLQQLPTGQYTVESSYDKIKQKNTVEITAGQTTPLNIVMGQTGKIEITASEDEGGKWVNVYHQIYTVDGEDKTLIARCSSSKKKACLQKLPIGQYTIEARYNKLTQKAVVDVITGKTIEINLVMGQTGKIEITASEEEGGKWVDVLHEIYKVENGDLIRQKGRMSGKKKAYIEQYPVGEYKIISSYKSFKQETLFNIKPGETTKVNVVMGQTGKVVISASETEGGKWVRAYHEVYALKNEERERVRGRYSKKSSPYTEQLPVGKYVIASKYKKVLKETVFDITASKTISVQVIFVPFTIGVKCTDSSEKVLYEIYNSKGRLVFEKNAKCSDTVTTSIDNGSYTIETTVANDTKSNKITVGSGKPNSLVVDMSKTDTSSDTPTDEQQKALIEADTEKQAPKFETETSAPITNKPVSNNAKNAADSAKENKTDKQLEAFRQSITASLPKFKEATACYRKTEELDQLKSCEFLEQEASNLAQNAIESITGNNMDKIIVKAHTEWNGSIKSALIKDKEDDINKMELSLVCFEKGIGLKQLEKCIENNGNP